MSAVNDPVRSGHRSPVCARTARDRRTTPSVDARHGRGGGRRAHHRGGQARRRALGDVRPTPVRGTGRGGVVPGGPFSPSGGLRRLRCVTCRPTIRVPRPPTSTSGSTPASPPEGSVAHGPPDGGPQMPEIPWPMSTTPKTRNNTDMTLALLRLSQTFQPSSTSGALFPSASIVTIGVATPSAATKT